mgnify:CR=1 FL=1
MCYWLLIIIMITYLLIASYVGIYGGCVVVTRSEMIENWFQYATHVPMSREVFLAGVGLLNEADNAEYYSNLGLPALLMASECEVHGTPTIAQYLGTKTRY